MDILLLCAPYQKIAATVEDQLGALERHSSNRYFRLPMKGQFVKELDLERFDALVIHYTIIASDDRDLSAAARDRIKGFSGLKAMFIQDEYRFVDRTVAAMQELDIHLLFTCVPEPEVEKVYPRDKLPDTLKVNVLTGYVPEYLLRNVVLPFDERKIDVGYRGRSVPSWLGELGQDKWRIGHQFATDAKMYGLKCDIAYREEDRLYGEAWTKFLCSCKAALGVESGASVFDFTGEIQRQVEEHELRHPETRFEDLRDLYFKSLEGNIRLNQISPRSFECAALRTAMILYEGEYSEILKPWRHYIPLKKDHSNMSEVVSALRDAYYCQSMTERTYHEVAENPIYGYRAFAEKVDQAMNKLFCQTSGRNGAAYSAEEFSVVQRQQQHLVFRYRVLAGVHRFVYFAVFKALLFWASPLLKHRVHLLLRRYYRGGHKMMAYWLGKFTAIHQGVREPRANSHN
jgi:hypothetical protein